MNKESGITRPPRMGCLNRWARRSEEGNGATEEQAGLLTVLWKARAEDFPWLPKPTLLLCLLSAPLLLCWFRCHLPKLFPQIQLHREPRAWWGLQGHESGRDTVNLCCQATFPPGQDRICTRCSTYTGPDTRSSSCGSSDDGEIGMIYAHEPEFGARSFSDFRRALICAKSPRSAVHQERDGFKHTLTYCVEFCPRLGLLSLNILKHNCFPSEKRHLTPTGFVQ